MDAHEEDGAEVVVAHAGRATVRPAAPGCEVDVLTSQAREWPGLR